MYLKIDPSAADMLSRINFHDSVDNILPLIPNNLFLDSIHNDYNTCFEDCSVHLHMIKNHIFVKPYWKWIRHLAQLMQNKRCVEICSGTGLISLALQTFGTNITAVDNGNRNIPHIIPTIHEDAHTFLSKHPFDVLLCCWPEMDDSFFQACEVFTHKNPGSIIIYCGEAEGGCTADINFFTNYDLDFLDIDYFPCFGVHDSFYYAKRKTYQGI